MIDLMKQRQEMFHQGTFQGLSEYAAVSILEQAYQHTPNITQSEKYKLAEVTGLQPRQVTIWFQNRRNRKAKAPPKPLKKSAKSQPEPKSQTAPQQIPPATVPVPLFPLASAYLTRSPTYQLTQLTSKRKPIAGLGLSIPDVSDTESNASSCASKKRRTARIASDDSFNSTCTIDTTDTAFSLDSLTSYNAWSASSNSSGSLSDDWAGQVNEAHHDPNSVAGNVFRSVSHFTPDQPMPEVTMTHDAAAMAAQQHTSVDTSSLSSAFRLYTPETSCTSVGSSFASPKQPEELDYVFNTETGNAQLDLADLELIEDSLTQALQQDLSKAFDFSSALKTPASHTQVTLEDDWIESVAFTPNNNDVEWVNIDEFTRAPKKQSRPLWSMSQEEQTTPTVARVNAGDKSNTTAGISGFASGSCPDQTPRPGCESPFQSTAQETPTNGGSCNQASQLSLEDMMFLSQLVDSYPHNIAPTQVAQSTYHEGQPCLDLRIDMFDIDRLFQLLEAENYQYQAQGDLQYALNFDDSGDLGRLGSL
nr:TPA_inf: bW [Testicularia cyperi]